MGECDVDALGASVDRIRHRSSRPKCCSDEFKAGSIEVRCSKCYQINKSADPFICAPREEGQSCRNSKVYRRWKDGTFATRSAHQHVQTRHRKSEGKRRRDVAEPGIG